MCMKRKALILFLVFFTLLVSGMLLYAMLLSYEIRLS